jgi:uncharacterized protein YbdZ (MbtH family)
MADSRDEMNYRVVVNDEEQYSIWPATLEFPLGWREAGKSGTKTECLAYVESVWSDMRPLSLRRMMESSNARTETPLPAPELEVSDSRDDLASYLSTGDHPVEATASSAEQFLQRIQAGHVSLRFTDTRGGTEFGLKLDPTASVVSKESAATPTGNVRLVGDLTLNYRKMRLVADLALDSLKGSGRLEPVEALL